MYIYIIIGVIVIILICFLVIYNKLVKLNNMFKEAFSTMDVYLKKRWDLIPNLVEVVKAYAKHEKKTLTEVVNLRNSVSSYDDMTEQNKLKTNEQLNGKLSKLLALQEAYPELKANKNYLDLSEKLVKIEDDIANSRKYYNGVVRILNNKIQMFPSNLVAKIFGFKTQNMFEATQGERESIKIEL